MERICGLVVIAFHAACADNIQLYNVWQNVIFKKFALVFTCFELAWFTNRKVAWKQPLFGASKFTFFQQASKLVQNWIALNALHGRQALATALQSNKTVVDIKLTKNECGDEGAEVWWTCPRCV